MIKTAIGDNIDCETLKHKFYEIIPDNFESLDRFEIDCFKEDNYLVILINESNPELIDRIKNILEEYQIVDNFIIRDFHDAEKIYFSKIEQNLEVLNKKNYYTSQNFSIGFIISILGIFSLGIVGIFYYFTRPCVLGNCSVIAEKETSISSQFKDKSQDLTEENIKNLQLSLITAINELKRIPPWSKFHEEATFFIKQYENEVNQLEQLLTALQLEKDSKSLTKNLPLSIDEWNRIKSFWQQAIELIKSITIEDLQSFKQEKLSLYQNQLTVTENNIIKEKQAEENLIKAQNLATEIENKEKQITTLTDLENIEKRWETAIKQIESIEPLTKAYQEKEQILNTYLANLIKIQKQITTEKNALNIKNQAQKTIDLALESQKNNQWTKAVSLWENAINSLKKISPNTLITKEIKDLEINTTKQLETAKSELKQAIVREEIKNELKNICNNGELRCSYSVDKSTVKIFLAEEYLKKIASLSNLNRLTKNNEQEKQINTHIEQVEKNYQYISTKYKILVEVYNPQRQLIMIYHTPI
ncbi:hypothetical protein [Geminocystis sp. NIES-3709]|uniref:hypothetical protein n=1 Tax=Geminocystis sp. NIES-3709 TaxID=1617448 RepID=UPI0005FC41A5|nr:hypothetical protein [Geminocystis sp. NIES-3709]BAQ64911.1 hypothetical protein GM3709_1676 [Geminocystis sp. NIES-3709]